LRHLHALAREQRRGTSGGEQVDAERREAARELDDPGFVGHGEQGARHGHARLHTTMEAVEVRSLFGKARHATALALQIDDPAALRAVLGR